MEENRVKYAVERFKEELSVLNKTIWEAAEIKYEEYRSEAAVIEVLRKHGSGSKNRWLISRPHSGQSMEAGDR